jgi:hypothetical protein
VLILLVIGIPHINKLKTSKVEYIFPQNWKQNHYTEWDGEFTTPITNTIGNMVLLEKRFYIKGKNQTFIDKTFYYHLSIFQETCQLFKNALNKIDNEKYDWLYAYYLGRLNKCKKILQEFFEGKYLPTTI